MSDWRSVHDKRASQVRWQKEINFGDKEDEVDDEDEEEMQQQQKPTDITENTVSTDEEIDDEELKKLEKKAKVKASMKRALKFGSSAGCMLGGMLGVYDAFRVYPGEKLNVKLGLRNISRSLPWGLFTMGGFFTIYELVKVGMMNYRESFDYYNNMTGCAVGLLPFMKVPFMRRYIMYPFVLFGLDMFGDWKEKHGKD